MKRIIHFVEIAFLIGFAILLDQLTKSWALYNLQSKDIALFDFPWLALTLTTNQGSALGTSLGEHFPYPLVSVLAVTGLFFFILKQSDLLKFFLFRLSFGLLVGGIVGNLLDRMRAGAVIDFIEISFFSNFNLADVFLVGGSVGLVFFLYKYSDKRGVSVS